MTKKDAAASRDYGVWTLKCERCGETFEHLEMTGKFPHLDSVAAMHKCKPAAEEVTR